MVIWPQVEQFGLLFVRVGAFVSMLPILGGAQVPAVPKLGLTGLLTYFMFTIAGSPQQSLPGDLTGFFLWVVVEATIGLGLGFLTKMLFSGVQMAGEIVGRQIGFSMAQTFDPTFQTRTSIMSEFYLMVMMLIYLIFNGPHFLIQGLAESYHYLPLGGRLSTAGIEVPVMEMAGGLFVSCVRVAAPVLATLMLTNIALGILARTVPQMNVFMVGLPLRIGVGLLAMVLTIQLFVYIFQAEWNQFQLGFEAIMRLLAG